MMLILITCLALSTFAEKPPNPPIITLSSTLILVQCTPGSFALVRNSCKRFEPMNPDCSSIGEESKYTLTHVEKCTAEMDELIQNSMDPFDPYHGSLRANSFYEPMTLHWYKDITEREEL